MALAYCRREGLWYKTQDTGFYKNIWSYKNKLYLCGIILKT
jgi:hypothetical protein